MPSRNTTRLDTDNSYYHIYARGASKQAVYLDDHDYAYFISLFARYLSKSPAKNKVGAPYPHLHNQVQLVSYCLLSNHFHLLLFQEEQASVTKLMRGIMTAYSRYFNLRYKCSGSLFESRYKSVRIDRQEYLEHISRYIHLNPLYWRQYKYSSLVYYRQPNNMPEWLRAKRVLDMFAAPQAYINFLEDYEDYKNMLQTIKSELADR